MAARLHVHSLDGGQPPGPGSGESILDVEDVSAMAPGATIDVYEAPNTAFGGLDEFNQIISSDRDEVVTVSWGFCETALQQGEPGFQQEENALFEEAAAQGQSVFAAAGDSGSDDCNGFETSVPVAPYLSVDDPGSQPYVVSVGGTTIEDATQPPEEHVWNDGALGGAGGGGISNSWVMPSWQAGATVPGVDPAATVATAEKVEGDHFCQGNPDGGTFGGATGDDPCREVPDVSAQADEFTGAVTVYSASFGPGASGWTTIGGTSSSAPIWAGLLADVNASVTCQGNDLTTSGVGFVSPLLYAVASSRASYAASFNDITTGNNDSYDIDNGKVFASTTGYDMASGLGSPQLTTPSGGDGLAYYLCSYAVSATRPTISNVDPSVVETNGSPSTVTVTGTGFEKGSAPDVSKIWVNNILLPADAYTVESPTTISLDAPPGDYLVPTDPTSDGSGPAVLTVTLTDGESSPITPASIIDSVDNDTNGPVPAVTGISSYGGAEAGGNKVTILGSGFSGDGVAVSSVTFGTVTATRFTVDNPFEITAVVPAFSSSGTKCETSLSSADDMCQTQVVVANANGSSEQYPIDLAYEGATVFNPNGVIPAPPGCGCEVVPAPSEYDYFPAPAITSLSTAEGGPASYASEKGTTTVTIDGRGLNLFAIEGLFFGPTSSEYSLDANYSYVSGTEIQVTAPPEQVTTDTLDVPVSIETLGGTSGSEQATYAGRPYLVSVSPSAATALGGQKVTVIGNGLEGTIMAEFTDAYTPYSFATQYTLDIGSDREATLLNPQQNPAVVKVRLCTATGCSRSHAQTSMIIYPPGNPVVTSASPASGPAHGGTHVTITGQNLGCVTSVWFGKTLAENFANAQALLDCGSYNSVEVRAPPGTAGTTVAITLETVESGATGYGASKAVKTAVFGYTDSAPSRPEIEVVGVGPDSASIGWQAPQSDGGSPITYYRVPAIAEGLPEQVAKLSPDAVSHHFHGLDWGVKWTIMVTAAQRVRGRSHSEGVGAPAEAGDLRLRVSVVVEVAEVVVIPIATGGPASRTSSASPTGRTSATGPAEPRAHAADDRLDARPGTIEDRRETRPVVPEHLVELLRRWRLLTPVEVVTRTDAVVVADGHPVDELLHPPDREWVRRPDLPEEARPPRERVFLVLVLGRLADESIEAHVLHRAPGDPHERLAGDARVGDDESGRPVARGSAARDHSRSA